ncbi:T-cell surface glycoprotein CD3 zeta chain [Protopterus annectens]|uniref:T-cell surface glycoprotein CD3 zeta chain n=1 Tax=Protopterus annectens TaxID=7888 RepID=UPI001CFB8488|nr:T-cell surface glycoprotein CD3 zeta chain [Protopterus annectens]
MKLKGFAVLLYAELRTAAASNVGLTDPKLCYILDGILFIYGIIITALYIKLKLSPDKQDSKGMPVGKDGETYQMLDKSRQDASYDELGSRKPRDPEAGKQRRRRNNETSEDYTALNLKGKNPDEYSTIGIQKQQEHKRRGKGNEGVYQGLSHASKDTYDSLQMQSIAPPPLPK